MPGEIEGGYAFDPYSSGGVLLTRARAQIKGCCATGKKHNLKSYMILLF